MKNITRIKKAKPQEIAEFLCYVGLTGSVPLVFPFSPPDFMKDEEYSKLIKVIREWLEREQG